MDYIEITVPKYPFAISCGGKYFNRSGSTLHELNGFELQNFLLERAGLTWDAVSLHMFSYDGLQRTETFPWPEEGFREVLLNAVNHKSYETGIPIQIRIYDDKITIWNDGQWPKTIDINKVYERHPSIPHNPKIANVFCRSDEIESWGSGFDKIRQECDRSEAPYPIINANPNGGVELECDACTLYLNLLKHGRYYNTYPKDTIETTGDSDTDQIDVNDKAPAIHSNEDQKSIDRMMDILSRKLSASEKKKLNPVAEYLKTSDFITRKKVAEITGKSRSTAANYLRLLVELDVLEKKETTFPPSTEGKIRRNTYKSC